MGANQSLRRLTALITVAAVLTSALWLFAAPLAKACSCEEMSSSAIEQADAAMSGTIVAMASIPSQYEDQDRFVAKVELTADLKDNLADEIYLTSERDDGGNCGVSWQNGMQIAAAIYETDGVLRASSCSLIPVPLLDSWQPAVTTGGEATLLIAGDPPNRVVAFDKNATPIAFAFEPGRVQAISLCPGGDVLLEIVNQRDNSTTFETRSLTTFEVTSSVPAVFEGEPVTVWDLLCEAPDGSAARTNGYALLDGVLTASDAPFVAGTFDPQGFWPALQTENTAPIRGESWMWRAIELDSPVTIEATGARAVIAQLGSGETFDLDLLSQEQVERASLDPTTDAAAQAEDSEPLVRQSSPDDGIDPALIRLLGVGVFAVIAAAVVVKLRRR